MFRLTVHGTDAQKTAARQTLEEFAAPVSLVESRVFSCPIDASDIKRAVELCIACLRDQEDSGRGCRIVVTPEERPLSEGGLCELEVLAHD